MSSVPGLLLAGILATLIGVMSCGNHTVTHEVWFEIETLGIQSSETNINGKFVIGLLGEAAPLTVNNFVEIANGFTRGNKKENKLHYKNSMVHRIIQDFAVQMGDITHGDGTGGRSIYGESFNDENFFLSHRGPGWVSMANKGPDTNTSQFFILLTKARWLDNKHVVFGKVIHGYDLIQKINEIPVTPKSQTPKVPVKIVNCGGRKLDKPYDLKPSQLDSSNDI